MHILLVEDHQDSRELLARSLTARGHDVVAAGDMRSAVYLLEKLRFDAIISDIALPDGTGYALIDAARRRGIQALGIAVSAFSFPEDVEEPGVTGFQYHLNKPINCDQLCFLLEKTV